MIGSGLAAFYMTRMLLMTFTDPPLPGAGLGHPGQRRRAGLGGCLGGRLRGHRGAQGPVWRRVQESVLTRPGQWPTRLSVYFEKAAPVLAGLFLVACLAGRASAARPGYVDHVIDPARDLGCADPEVTAQAARRWL